MNNVPFVAKSWNWTFLSSVLLLQKCLSSYGGFNHVLLAVDSFSSYVSYIPIKSMTKPQRFISALTTKDMDAGDPIKYLKMDDDQFHTPDIMSYLDSINVTYTYAPPYEHEFIGKIEQMNRTVQDKLTCALQISIIKSKKLWLFALLDVIMKQNIPPRRHLAKPIISLVRQKL